QEGDQGGVTRRPLLGGGDQGVQLLGGEDARLRLRHLPRPDVPGDLGARVNDQEVVGDCGVANTPERAERLDAGAVGGFLSVTVPFRHAPRNASIFLAAAPERRWGLLREDAPFFGTEYPSPSTLDS